MSYKKALYHKSSILIYAFVLMSFPCAFGMNNAIPVLYDIASRAEPYVDMIYGAWGVGNTLYNTDPSPSRNTMHHNTESDQSSKVHWSDVEMVTANNERMTGTDINHVPSFIDKIVTDYQKSIQANDITHCSSTNAETNPSNVSGNTTTVFNATTDLATAPLPTLAADQADIGSKVISTPIPSEATTRGIDESIFSVSTAADNREMIAYNPADLKALDTLNETRMNSGLASAELLQATKNQTSLNQLDKVMGLSKDPETLAVQFAAMSGTLGVIDCDTQIALRDFLCDNNDFNIVDTQEKQEALFNILTPTIKKHFANNREGFLEYLKNGVLSGRPGFKELYDRETGQATLQDNFFRVGSSIYSFLSNNRFTNRGNKLEKINKGQFVTDLAQVVQLCKAGKFGEAQESIEKIKNARESLADDTRAAALARYECLCAIYRNISEKALNKFSSEKKDGEVQGSGAVESKLVPSYKKEDIQRGNSNVVPANNAIEGQGGSGGMIPDPDDNEVKRKIENRATGELQNKVSLRDTKTFRDAENQIAVNSSRFEKNGLKPISRKTLKHIVNEHTAEGVQGVRAGKSLFNRGENFIELMLDGWERGSLIRAGEKIYDAGRIIGIDKTGSPTSQVKMFLDETGNSIATIFPY